jgi:hypothetical protein
MSDFYKRFMVEDGRKLAPDTGRFVALAAFGKHPGWDDHIEGEHIGLETDSLILAKNIIYNQGVSGQIDTGAWEKLPEDQKLAGFNHTFLWQRADQFLLGRLWSSSDGKGRTRYPMILCAQCIGVPLGWALQNFLPRLLDVERACQATNSQTEVRSLLENARTSLRNLVSSAPSSDPAPDATALRLFIGDPAFGPEKEGWFRILYWLRSQASRLSSSSLNLKEDLESLRAQQIRVPAGSPAPEKSAPLWSQFFTGHISRRMPILLVWPSGESWIDVTFGEPSTREFFCLRANRAATPLATEVPYNLEPKFREEAAQQLNDFEGGRAPQANPSAGEKTSDGEAQSGFASVTQRWFKKLGGKTWLFLAGILVLATVLTVAIAHYLAPHPGQRDVPAASTQDQKPRPPTQTVEKRIEPPAAPAKIPAPTQPIQPSSPPSTVATAAVLDSSIQQSNNPPIQPVSIHQSTNLPVLRSPPAEVLLTKEGAADGRGPTPSSSTSPSVSATAAPSDSAIHQSTNPPVLRSASDEGGPTQPSSLHQSINPTIQAAAAAPAAPENHLSPSVQRPNFTNSIGMPLVWVAGLPSKPNGAWVGKFEVTQSEFQKVMSLNPSKSQGDLNPVENVSWDEAATFCHKLTELEQRAGTLPQGFVYSLPSQAQWEFFAADAKFEDAITSRDQPAIRTNPLTVGARPPNQFGLHDILGNVWEWCADTTPSSERILKGGAYNNKQSFQFKPLDRQSVWLRAADAKSPDAGFRCILAPAP